MRKLLIASFFLTSLAFADTLTLTMGTDNIPQSAMFNGTALARIGSGIRQKRRVINWDIYRATLFADSPAKFVRKIEGKIALESLQTMDILALNMHFMREVSTKDILNSFNDAFKKNSVVETPALAQFRDAIQKGGDIKEGASVKMTIDNKRGILVWEQGSLNVEIKGNKEFFRDILSLWLGEATDVGVTNLKKALINGN